MQSNGADELLLPSGTEPPSTAIGADVLDLLNAISFFGHLPTLSPADDTVTSTRSASEPQSEEQGYQVEKHFSKSLYSRGLLLNSDSVNLLQSFVPQECKCFQVLTYRIYA